MQGSHMAIAVARGGPPTGRFTGRLDPKCLDPRLFREAPQLTTVGTAVSVAGTEAGHVEIQIHAKGAANCRCPTVSALADAHWSPQSSTESCVAEARGAPAGRFIGRLGFKLGARLPLGVVLAHCPPRARGSFIPRGNATENRWRDCLQNCH